MFLSGLQFSKPLAAQISGAPPGHEARILSECARKAEAPLIFVAQDDIRAAFVTEALSFFDPLLEIIAFPAWDCLPYDRVSPHTDVLGQRLSVLGRLAEHAEKPEGKKNCLIITTVNAIGQRLVPQEQMRQAILVLSIGTEMPVEKLRQFLAINGYVAVSTVREPGEFAVRGGIVDLFPPGGDQPARLDFFGDEVEQIRVFDPLTQTTTGKREQLTLRPISESLLTEQSIATFRASYREIFGAVTDKDPLYAAVSAGQKFPGMEHWLPLFYRQLVSLFDYLPNSALIFDWQSEEALSARAQQVKDFYEARLSLYQAGKRTIKNQKAKSELGAVYKPVPPERLFLSVEEIQQNLAARVVGYLSPFANVENESVASRTANITTSSDIPGAASHLPRAHFDGGGKRGRDFAADRARAENGLYEALQNYIGEQNGQNRRVAIACYSQGSAERIASLLKAHTPFHLRIVKTWDEARKLDKSLVPAFILGLDHGFVAPDLAVVTEQDILGDRLVRPARKRKAAAQFQLELGDMSPGDFVVHAEHGIGRYEGLETISALGLSHDCVRLIYDGGDKLFVPVENLDVLSKYGSAESGATLDKLGGVAWQSRKARVKNRLKDMAEALMKIAAERQLKTGSVVELQSQIYDEFAARFPYPETEDQARAIESVLDDLASGKPMDRLVCGDVGFGKTEVALRAAFAAVQAGLQVAVVVPTTLLARQHYNNFSRRFAGFPYKVVQLSRMVSAAESKQSKELLASGAVDVVVGTHALLSKDIKFDRLGLLIVDEEQHFGVKQKEQLKALRADVHVLTLTATPIPRTLQLALAGVRELSLITTAPVDRLAVRSFVLPYDGLVVREALMREHYRGGQSFYVCPRIEDLAAVAEELREIVPEIKLVMAHGRMSPTELEDIMTAFDARQFDLLLATNIIESGLDIPNANTIILHRADMFGLAQLYQLRGRVGRAKLRGYAYFTYPAGVPLSTQAQQRLEVIQTLEQLGAGFQLASHDMDIRGAGNLLGEEQSGHIREVGIELYQQMLDDAVAAARLAAAEQKRSDSKSAGLNAGANMRGAAATEMSESFVAEKWIPQITLGMSVLIPERYVTDLNVRLALYRRLADVGDESEVEAIAAEMIDRFGSLPVEVENLLQTVLIKALCRKAGIAKLDAGPKGGVIAFRNDVFSRPDLLLGWIAKQAGTVKVRPDQKLAVMRAWDNVENRLSGVKTLLKDIADMAV